VKSSAEDVALVPRGVTTVTLTVLAEPAGEVTVIEVELPTASDVPGVLPKLTAVAPMKLVPVRVTDVPPAVVPVVGDTALTVGTPSKVNWSAEEVALVPTGVTTVTSTVLADSAGDFTVMEVADTTVRLVPAVLPKSTTVAPVKLLPVSVTDVPPLIVPTAGDTALTVGAVV
jgi:hypothetical protein